MSKILSSDESGAEMLHLPLHIRATCVCIVCVFVCLLYILVCASMCAWERHSTIIFHPSFCLPTFVVLILASFDPEPSMSDQVEQLVSKTVWGK